MIKAKKHFGQNFLKDQSVLTKIIQSIPKNNSKFENMIVEIGAGLGDLTFWLLGGGFCVTSYEIDGELIPILNDKFKKEIQSEKFRLINADANLVWQSEGSLCDKPYILVANLPYYVATKMVLNAIADENCVAVVAMTQKEVALKFSCSGDDGDFSALGVLANLASSCQLLFDVPPECFEPVPKVISSVFMIHKTAPLFGDLGLFLNLKEYEKFKDFLKVCFSSPRKMLFKNLSSKFEKGLLNLVFSELLISQNIRPHQLNATLYLEIYNKIKVQDERRKQQPLS